MCVFVCVNENKLRIMMLKESDRLVGKVKQAVTSLCGQSVCFLFVILASKSKAVGMLELNQIQLTVCAYLKLFSLPQVSKYKLLCQVRRSWKNEIEALT